MRRFTGITTYVFGIFLILLLLGSLYLSQRFMLSKGVEGFDDRRKPIDSNIDAIYYINLNKREDRKKEFLDNFPAVDESRIIRVTAHEYPENGAVGCLMSHVTALSRALEGPGENILICEDDLTIKDMDYCNRMLALLFENIRDWDVVMLGQNTIESEDTKWKTDKGEKIIRIKNSQTASGYLIKKAYIPKLLDIYGRDLTDYVRTGQWGNYFTDQSWKVLQPADKWYSFSPTVAVQRPSYSDIQKGNITTEV
jgi:glycosyl transferase, family 25